MTSRAQEEEAMSYRRSSLYNIAIIHTEQEYSSEILEVYSNRTVSDKFNDHALNVVAVAASGEKFVDKSDITAFLEKNAVANRLVAEWFNRDKYSALCDMELIYHRGMEAATATATDVASMTKRNEALLRDAGVELIGNTFVLVHDITYIDKGEQNQKVASGISVAGAIIGGILQIAGATQKNSDLSNIGNTVNLLSSTTSLVVSNLEGFRVNVKTHLYQLEWDENATFDFYENYYVDTLSTQEEIMVAKERWKNAHYKLKYVGSQQVKSSKVVMAGIHKPQDVIKKVVYRALDESVVNLQKNFEVFRLKEPVYMIDKKTVRVKIGLKEGVSSSSKYEVLETVVDASGKTSYKRVGTLVPDSDLIWDNRFMSIEEGAENSELGYTTFKIKSGSGSIFPGMTIREIRF